MAAYSPLVRSTNWQGVFVATLIPLLVAASLVYAAIESGWDGSAQWAYGLLALLPVEWVRTLVLSILGDSFGNYHSRGYAVNHFLLSIAILAVVLLVIAGYLLGVGGLMDALGDRQTWRFILPLAAVMIVDGLITLWFFTGDPGVQAARLEAASEDVADLLGLALYPTPMLVAAGYGVLFWLRNENVALAAWVPDISIASLRALALFYVAAYFSAKAGIFAYVQTARFNRSGERLLGGSWVNWLRGRDEEQRIRDLHEEQAAATRRRAALGLNDFRALRNPEGAR